MIKEKRNKGFSLIELVVVIAIIALLASIAVPTYARVRDRAQRSVALNNAQAIISCINGHNRVAKADDTVTLILGTLSGEVVIFSGVNTDGNLVDNIDSLDKFNDICENKIWLLTEEDYDIAIKYIVILSPSDEFAVNGNYNHTT